MYVPRIKIKILYNLLLKNNINLQCLQAKQVDCNPFNKTMVVCALGNPLKKSTFTNIQLRFDPEELNDAENRLEFIVFSNSTSHEIEPQNPLILSAIVIKQAELSLNGYNILKETNYLCYEFYKVTYF